MDLGAVDFNGIDVIVGAVGVILGAILLFATLSVPLENKWLFMGLLMAVSFLVLFARLWRENRITDADRQWRGHMGAMLRGDKANPLFAALAKASGQPPKWNFHKYLIDRQGRVVKSFPSQVEPLDGRLTKEIEAALAAN